MLDDRKLGESCKGCFPCKCYICFYTEDKEPTESRVVCWKDYKALFTENFIIRQSFVTSLYDLQVKSIAVHSSLNFKESNISKKCVVY